MPKIILPILLLSLLGCETPKPEADLILYNGHIYSLNWSEPDLDGTPAKDAPFVNGKWKADATAIAIKDGKIMQLGDDEKILGLTGEYTRQLDLKGQFVYPGFVDSHTHPFELGEKLERVDLTGIETEEEAIGKIVEKAKSTPEGEWIVGMGFDEGAWANRMPDKKLLTEKVPNHPVFMNGLHGFAGWVNQKALDEAGITQDTPTPVGGTIGFDEKGEPNGQFYNNAVDLIEAAVPAYSNEQLKQIAINGLNNLASYGYTRTHQAGINTAQMKALQELAQENNLPIRLYGMIRLTDAALAQNWLQKGPMNPENNFLNVRSIKAFYDGSLGVRGARLLEDYSDMPGHKGVSGENYGFDQVLAEKLMAKGFQMSIHAIGDAANREVLDFFEKVYKKHPQTRANRNRIEHAQVIHSDDFSRFHELDIIASMEPPHMAEDKLWAEDRLGPERIKGAYAWRTLRMQNARLTFNSDLPGSDHDIFYGLYAAIARRDKNQQPEGGWYVEERLSPEESLRAYTSWAAYSAFWEEHTGTLSSGKWADISIINIDILNEGIQHPENLLGGKILMTIVNGEIVFEDFK